LNNLLDFEDLPENLAQLPHIAVKAKDIGATLKTALKMLPAPATILLARNDQAPKNDLANAQVKDLFLRRQNNRIG
jgi:hypothetical protein